MLYFKVLFLLQGKYEKELKDAIARELMHAEEAALLDKVTEILFLYFIAVFYFCPPRFILNAFFMFFFLNSVLLAITM